MSVQTGPDRYQATMRAATAELAAWRGDLDTVRAVTEAARHGLDRTAPLDPASVGSPGMPCEPRRRRPWPPAPGVMTTGPSVRSSATWLRSTCSCKLRPSRRVATDAVPGLPACAGARWNASVQRPAPIRGTGLRRPGTTRGVPPLPRTRGSDRPTRVWRCEATARRPSTSCARLTPPPMGFERRRCALRSSGSPAMRGST